MGIFDILEEFDSNLHFKWLPEAGLKAPQNEDYIEKRESKKWKKKIQLKTELEILNGSNLSKI